MNKILKVLKFCREKLLESNAHYVVDSVAQLPLVIEDIETRMKNGERP